MGTFPLTIAIVLILHVSMSLGEADYRYSRIVSDPYYYYPDRYRYQQNTYYNPYANYRYTSTPVVKYSEPVRTYPAASNYYDDDKVYITDKYGQTTVQSSANYQNYVSSRNSRNYVARYSAMAPTTSCTSSTCGLNAQCSMTGGHPVCSCFRGYMGDPLHNCRRAECLDNSECRGHQTCQNEHCVDPCADVCGTSANCETRNHIPICTCPEGYTGNPLSHCRRFDPSELCHPSPCGSNTLCEVNNAVPTCKCLPGYHGSPITGCRHECDSSAECGSHLACIEFKCQNPCHTQCGINAECEGVRNNAAICTCPRGYFGNAYSSCQPECTTHSDCPPGKPACYQNSCKNPCDGVCGVGANCELRDITPVCSCPKDMTGDPFVRCRPFEKRDLCDPNPCGTNAHCEPGYDKYDKERPVCTCLPGYQGDPLRGCVRGECTEDAHCSDHQACFDYNCRNPCTGQCGSSAECNARRHLAVCTCPVGYNGDALTNCYQVSGTSVSRRFYRHIIEMEKKEEEARNFEAEHSASNNATADDNVKSTPAQESVEKKDEVTTTTDNSVKSQNKVESNKTVDIVAAVAADIQESTSPKKVPAENSSKKV